MTNEPECPVSECRHVRELKVKLDRIENILYLAIGLGLLNLIGGFI